MNCPNCNAEMMHIVEGFTCGWKCSKCSLEFVTSYNDPILLDENEYKVTVNKVDNPKASQIKMAAEICKCNYLLSKEKLLEGFSLYELNAEDTRVILSKLKEEKLSFSVNPDFDYKY